jgi:hypothetical protein
MNSKKWIKIFVLFSLSAIGFVGLVNYIVDPLWFFNHSNNFNKLQYGFNERLLKSSYIKHRENILDNKDTLLLGASTTTYFNENKFPGFSVYNYAVSSGAVNEYETFTKFSELQKKGRFKNIMIGLDFNMYFSHLQAELLDINSLDYKTEFTINKYLSLQTFKYSLINIKRSLTNATGHRAYTRNNIVKVDKVAPDEVNKLTKIQIKKYLNYVVNPKYFSTLKNYKTKYSDRNFVVFTTPLAEPLLNEIYNNKQLKDAYIQWIKDITTVFGKIYFFTLPNEFSKNYLTLSKDAGHFYPEVGGQIGDIIFNQKMEDSLGIIFTKENIDKKMNELEEIIKININ